MDSPREWADRMDQKSSGENAKPAPIESAGLTSSPAGDFPSEPFNCPACGQLLGATTRVCPVCKSAINPAEIGRSAAPVFAVPSSVATVPRMFEAAKVTTDGGNNATELKLLVAPMLVPARFVATAAK